MINFLMFLFFLIPYVINIDIYICIYIALHRQVRCDAAAIGDPPWIPDLARPPEVIRLMPTGCVVYLGATSHWCTMRIGI